MENKVRLLSYNYKARAKKAIDPSVNPFMTPEEKAEAQAKEASEATNTAKPCYIDGSLVVTVEDASNEQSELHDDPSDHWPNRVEINLNSGQYGRTVYVEGPLDYVMDEIDG